MRVLLCLSWRVMMKGTFTLTVVNRSQGSVPYV